MRWVFSMTSTIIMVEEFGTDEFRIGYFLSVLLKDSGLG